MRTIDDLFQYVAKHRYELVHHSNGDKVVFFKHKAEWICWCCGGIRVIINGSLRCVYGIVYKESVVRSDMNQCIYYIDGGCSEEGCVKVVDRLKSYRPRNTIPRHQREGA